MKGEMMRCVWVVLLVVAASAVGQDAKEYDLTWKLPHDRAAIYDVWDVAKKTKRGEFWLLGCELEGRVGALDGSDLPYRFLFRVPRQTVKVGVPWMITEIAFGDSLDEMEMYGPSQLQIVGTYRLRDIQTTRIEDVLGGWHKDRKHQSALIELARIEGQFEVYRCRKNQGRWIRAESKPSAWLSTVSYTRTTDATIMGGTWTWHGRLETGKDLVGSATAKSDESRELSLKETVELSQLNLKERIDKAIKKGVDWLLTRQQQDGRISDPGNYLGGTLPGVGATCLSVMALLHAGMAPNQAAVKSAIHFLMNQEIRQSYDLAVFLMMLEAKYLPTEAREDFNTLSEENVRKLLAQKLGAEDKSAAEVATRKLLAIQAPNGGFGYSNSGEHVNLSNTSFSIMGLRSASRLGIEIPASVWKRAIDFVESASVRSGQPIHVRIQYDGNKTDDEKVIPIAWQYMPPTCTEFTGTMASAALVVLATSRDELSYRGDYSETLSARVDALKWGGLAWLQSNFGVRGGTPEGCWDRAAWSSFYLYGLERVGLLFQLQSIGGHNWYLEGAAVLLSSQHSDGRWETPQHVSILDTVFALLFLKRAAVPVATPSRSTED